MKKKSKNNLILGIILVGFIVGALYFSGVLNTILQLGGQWSHVNVTLSQEQIKIGEGADLNLKFNPVKQMIAECPGGGFNAFAVVSIYVDNSFYKIINLNDIKCDENTTLKVNLPHNLSIGEHNITAKIGVMRFLETKKITTYRLSVNGSKIQGSVDKSREEYFFEKQLQNQAELYTKIINKISIPKVCYDVKDRLESCHCGGKVGPLNLDGCPSYACYNRCSTSKTCYKEEGCGSKSNPKKGACTKVLNAWSWGYTTYDFNQIKSYILGQEHTDFDYFPYVKMDNMVETTEKLIVMPEEAIVPIVNTTITPMCEKIYFECWDKSKILQYDCINNVNVKTSTMCPTSPDAPVIIEDNGDLDDTNESVIMDNEIIQKEDYAIYYIIGGIIATLLAIILFIKYKK